MVLLITKKFSFAILIFVGIFENIWLVSSKPFLSNREGDCFESCGHKLFKISEKVYDSGNISSKCSPYYSFGKCVEKCYNHHDTTISFQFLKKCDETVHKHYDRISNQEKCLQQNFGKVRESCSLRCAKEAINQTDDDNIANDHAVNDKKYLDLENLCLNQICKLRCLDRSIEEHCPKTSKNIMSALLAPFNVFENMMKKFSSHRSFKKSLFSSSCKELFDENLIEKKLHSTFDNNRKIDTFENMSDFVSDIKPTPPNQLKFVSQPPHIFGETTVNSISDDKMNIVDKVEVNEDYEEFNIIGDRNIGHDKNINELKHFTSNEHEKNQNVVYQAQYSFDNSLHTFNFKPSKHHFTGHLSNECGDIMIIDNDKQIPRCSNPTLYFVTTEKNTIENIYMNEGMVERYNSGSISLEEIYEQYKNLLDRMRVSESQMSSLFESNFGDNLSSKNNDVKNEMLRKSIVNISPIQNLKKNDAFVEYTDDGEEDKLDYHEDFERFTHVGDKNNLKEEFVKNTMDHNGNVIDSKLSDVNDYEEKDLDDEIEDNEDFEDNDRTTFSNNGKEFTTSSKISNNGNVNLPLHPALNNFFQSKVTRSEFTTPKFLSGSLSQKSNSQLLNEEIVSDTKHFKSLGDMLENKKFEERRGPTFHGQEEDFSDRFNNVLPDRERISYGLNGRLVARSPLTFRSRLPNLTRIHGRRTDNH